MMNKGRVESQIPRTRSFLSPSAVAPLLAFWSELDARA